MAKNLLKPYNDSWQYIIERIIEDGAWVPYLSEINQSIKLLKWAMKTDGVPAERALSFNLEKFVIILLDFIPQKYQGYCLSPLLNDVGVHVEKEDASVVGNGAISFKMEIGVFPTLRLEVSFRATCPLEINVSELCDGINVYKINHDVRFMMDGNAHFIPSLFMEDVMFLGQALFMPPFRLVEIDANVL